MTRADLESLVIGLTPILQEFSAAVSARLSAIDGKAKGLDGPPGERGPKGETGRDGRDGLIGIPGIDGKDGKDGRDGLGFDDLAVEHDGERSFTVAFVRGDVRKVVGTFSIPAQIYRGVYQRGRAYDRGDTVTFGGSLWVATEATSAVPGESKEASRAWALAVKAGRDGKDGKPGPEGKPGAQGRAGHDLTQLGRDGQKW